MRLGTQGNNSITTQKLNQTAVALGLPENQPFLQRRIARAFDLVATDKVTEVDDSIFRVRSQYDPSKAYIVNLNGDWGCNCPDHQKNTGAGCDASLRRRLLLCKHMIASMLYAQKQAQEAITIIKTTDGNEGDYWRRCWLIAQGNRRTLVYEERDRRLFCTCGAYYNDCEHKQLVIKTVTKELKEKRILNECGSNKAKALQDKMNGQLDSRTGGFVTADNHHNNGNGASKPPSQLDLSNPFQQSEQLDIDQIESAEGAPPVEGRSNGELVHHLSNGEYVISYKGIMKLSEKHDISFELATHDDTNTIIAKGRRNGSERVSGKPINGSVKTSGELAKRNCARQLLPFAEIKVLELKAKLEADFSGKFDTATPD